MSDEQPSDTSQTAPPHKSVVIATSVATGMLLYVIAMVADGSYGGIFFAIPVFMGLVIGLLTPTHAYTGAWIALFIALLAAVATLREGVVCMLFSLPVLVPMVMLGAFAGSVLRRHLRTRRSQRIGVGLVILLGAGAQAWAAASDDVRSHPIHVAESERVIAAPPERIFATLTARELRVAQRWPWFIRIGLPMPERMTVEQPGLGGSVRFEFAQMTAFGRITAWDPPRTLQYALERYELRDLPFHITRLGRGPDYGLRSERMSDWLSVLDTAYTIEPLANGQSRLRRRIVWQRHLAPDLYFGWLQQTVIERGQQQLLALIAERVEVAAPSRPDVIGAARP